MSQYDVLVEARSDMNEIRNEIIEFAKNLSDEEYKIASDTLRLALRYSDAEKRYRKAEAIVSEEIDACKTEVEAIMQREEEIKEELDTYTGFCSL